MASLHETLRTRIITGDLEAGSRLHQADLADELGVSHIPVRDAPAVETLTRAHLETSHEFILRYLLELGVSS